MVDLAEIKAINTNTRPKIWRIKVKNCFNNWVMETIKVVFGLELKGLA